MRFRHILLLVFVARVTSAQTADTPHRSGASVSGVVRDSIAGAPLPGAIVQLLAIDEHTRFRQSVSADSLGQYRINDVPDGRYVLGFFHPLLDSLSLEPMLTGVAVSGQRSVSLDLGVPSSGRLRRAICGVPAGASSDAALVTGVVRDATTREPVGGVMVAGEWVEVTIARSGTSRQVQRVVSRTADNGWFAICNAPPGGTMWLRAARDADSTGRLEIHVPSHGFLRRELFLAAAGSARTSHAVSAERLSGLVLTADGGRPITGARVIVAGMPQALTNERGEWVLSAVPAGSRMIDVRAIGYYPESHAVDVVPGVKPMQFELSTVRAVLDTVRVTAQRRAKDLNEFEQRRRSNAGQYFTAEDIARRAPLYTSDLFRNMAGVRLQQGTGTDVRLQVRGNMSTWCTPAIFLDGARISGSDGYATPGITLEDLDAYLRPNEIAGIEVYAGTGAPVQYQQDIREEIASSTPLVAANAARTAGGENNSQVRNNPSKPDESNCGTILLWKRADAP